VFADAETDVAPERRVGFQDAGSRDVGQVRLGKVRRAAEQLRQRTGQGVDRLLTGLASRRAVAGGIALEDLVPTVGELAGQTPLQLGGLGREVAGVAGQRLVPLRDELPTGRNGLAV